MGNLRLIEGIFGLSQLWFRIWNLRIIIGLWRRWNCNRIWRL